MNKTALIPVTEDYDDDAVDVTDFIDMAVENEAAYIDADELPRIWWPDNFVEGLFGSRGSGKSLRMAYHLLNGLADGKEVFTNLTLHPENAGIDRRPRPLILDQMVSFDPILNQGVMGIEEIGTWIRRERAMATSTQLLEQFLTQLRKRGLVIEFTNQSLRLPPDLWDQVDLVTFCEDMYFSEFGREQNIRKGTVFLYTHIDKSGIFTGTRAWEPRFWWQTGHQQADLMWDKYETEQVQDPLQAFRRVRILGGDVLLNAADGQVYGEDEMRLVNRENRLRLFNRTLTSIWRQWDDNLLGLARKKHAILDDTDEKMAFSAPRMRSMVLGLRGNDRRAATEAWRDLVKLADDGKLARYRDGSGDVIELYKPV